MTCRTNAESNAGHGVFQVTSVIQRNPPIPFLQPTERSQSEPFINSTIMFAKPSLDRSPVSKFDVAFHHLKCFRPWIPLSSVYFVSSPWPSSPPPLSSPSSSIYADPYFPSSTSSSSLQLFPPSAQYCNSTPDIDIPVSTPFAS